MVTVGITGGIGSGKSTVCAEWDKLGAVIVYADDFAKELMVGDQELVEEIRSAFGSESYFADGTLNREFLASEAFARGRADELNKLVHPVVSKRVRDRMSRAEKEGADMFVEEAALLLDKGRPDIFDYIVLVTAGKSLRLDRVSERDGAPAEDVIARMKRQRCFDELLHLCDFVISNDSSLAELRKEAVEVYHQMKGKGPESGAASQERAEL
ncbi:MAG: dephospho-CoA kinase [Balneolaceae bacterium]